MSTKERIEYTNKQVREQLTIGRGRLVVVELDKAAKEQIERKDQ